MAGINAALEGAGELSRELRRLERKYPEALAAAMFEEGVEIFNESQDQVPVDTGALRRSGIIFLRREGMGYGVVIGYGTEYALPVHENTKADAGRQARAELALSNPGFKPRGAQSGKSKYLEDPYLEALPGLVGRIAARTMERVRRGGSSVGDTRTVRGRGR
jgi:hypothetical protein